MTAGFRLDERKTGGHRPPLQWGSASLQGETQMKNIIALIVMLFLVNAALWGQSVSVSQIKGTAKDQSGALLPGVDVKVTQTETGLSRSAVTDETGAYSVSNLPVGPYRLEVSLPGFKTYVQTGIVLQVNTN